MPTVNIDCVIMSSHDVFLVNYIICSATSYPECIAVQLGIEYIDSSVHFLCLILISYIKLKIF